MNLIYAPIKMKNILIMLLLLGCFSVNAQSPVSISKKVITLPAAFEKPNENTNIYNSDDKTSLPWIVFSDRDENYTYTSPGGTLIMKKLKFMDPFYVSEERNGYIKLIKYQPGMVQGRKLTNKKSSQSYGWISKSKVLLWQSAFINQGTYPSKYIAVISGKNPLLMPDFYYDKTDSLYVFTSPELERKKTKLALNNIVYVFKKSDDGKKMLVGSEGQLVADSAARSVYGWVAADALHNWGNRLYIGSAKNNTTDVDDSAATAINQAILVAAPPTTSTYFKFDPLITPDEPVLRSLPVITGNVLNPNDKLGTGLAVDVYDKSNNSILNVKGSHLKYLDYLNIRKNIHHINVVFVVDGGSTMRNYFSGITSTIQSFENIFNAHIKGNQITYGGVVYRNAKDCPSGGINKLNFTTDYRELVKYFDKQASVTNGCGTTLQNQPVFEGINTALTLFKGHTNETNLIVLIGTTGSADYNADDIANVADQMAAADARLLAIQVFSDYNPIYNDFVIQARRIVSQSAIKLADLKKQRMITGEGLSNVQQFNTSLSDSISFYLDYPKNSMIQGAVVFPPKGVVKTNQAMRLSVDRLMRETDYDINTQVHALDSAFRLTGRENRFVQPGVIAQVSPVANDLGNNMPHNAFKYFISAELPANIVSQHSGQLQYLLILNEQEYNQLTDILSLMIGENLQQDASDYRKKLFKNYVDIIQKRLNQKISKGDIKDMPLSTYFKTVTGLPLPGKNNFQNTKVADLRGDMPQAQFEGYIKFLVHSSEQVKRSVLVNQHFTSNGKTYFYITQANLQ
ncbi:type VI secretion system protein TssR domain-containing protein [Mucilaginibacter sp. RCC_168]|uniref:type VI secretion system protein TssR domain-containing protein n=1 Tax=Mucilaginibacter sp. RCC_168 TaxID=3239221 RepID=UPI003525384B